MNRRQFLSHLSASALAGVAAPFLPTGHREAIAAAPFAGGQAPGFYRVILGDYEITALSDGTIRVPLDKLYRYTTAERVDAALSAAFLRNPVELSVNAYLVNTGRKLVLIDAGTGPLLGPTLGRLPASLRAAGYQPEQIDDIILTHIHTDHSGGLSVAGKAAFPNAKLHVNKREIEYWFNPANRDAAPESARQRFREASEAVAPYKEAGLLIAYADNADPIPEFRSVLRRGHTPGHSSIVIESGGETLVVWGDITHGDVIQFDEPGVSIDFDVDTAEAASTRQVAFGEAVQRGYLVAGAHIAFPGIGHVRTDSNGYDWLPVNYTVPGNAVKK